MKRRINILATILALLVVGASAQTKVVPKDTDVKVRTDSAIPAKPADNAKYTASVSSDVKDGSGSRDHSTRLAGRTCGRAKQ